MKLADPLTKVTACNFITCQDQVIMFTKCSVIEYSERITFCVNRREYETNVLQDLRLHRWDCYSRSAYGIIHHNIKNKNVDSRWKPLLN